jgi:FlaA1/EpsC-like NDP-sugar epimerase
MHLAAAGFDYIRKKSVFMKSAIVTGASGNLGKAVVEQLLKSGYRVSQLIIPGIRVPVSI